MRAAGFGVVETAVCMDTPIPASPTARLRWFTLRGQQDLALVVRVLVKGRDPRKTSTILLACIAYYFGRQTVLH